MDAVIDTLITIFLMLVLFIVLDYHFINFLYSQLDGHDWEADLSRDMEPSLPDGTWTYTFWEYYPICKLYAFMFFLDDAINESAYSGLYLALLSVMAFSDFAKATWDFAWRNLDKVWGKEKEKAPAITTSRPRTKRKPLHSAQFLRQPSRKPRNTPDY